jgi:cell surface protein SprA
LFSTASEARSAALFFPFNFHSLIFFEESSPGMNDSIPLVPHRAKDSLQVRLGTRDTLSRLDTLRLLPKHTRDSLARADSIRQIPRDSTARVAQFVYNRRDSQTASMFEGRSYSMYAKPPVVVVRTVALDSTGRYVIVRETVNGADIKVPQKVPLSEYIRLRYRYEMNRSFEDAVFKYDVIKKGNDLGDLLGSFTNIDIPIPANPVFSIFGPPRINLHISGAVDIHAAFRTTTTDQITLSALGNTRNEPDFAQEVQINVSGTIGDKLNILADWNTQRTFEYENQLRIKYTGYDDEVVQGVEAGNVSLSTNSSFISSSSALFGIKAAFQFGPLKMTAIASQKKGQIQEKNITGGSQEREFNIHSYEYNTDHFFLDASYIPLFEQFYATHQGDGSKQIVDYEVWVTTTQTDYQKTTPGVAYLDLPGVRAEDIAATYKPLRDPAQSLPLEKKPESARWEKLRQQVDYTIHPYAGYISLNTSLQANQALAIAYRVENNPGPNDDTYYGTFYSTLGQDSVLVLKLIKPRGLVPQNKAAWRLLMKNIYSLGGAKDIKKAGFDLHIYYSLSGQEPVDEIGGKKLLELFGLDNLRDDNSPGTDNNFDYNPPYTVDEARGEIIFPTVEPFLGVRKDTSGGRPIEGGLKKAFDKYKLTVPVDSFSFGDIYDTTSLAASYNSSRDRFFIKGKTTAGSSSTISLGFNIVENSVQVLLNGQPLTQNVDYTVDYIVGQVIIKNQAALIPGANLQVKYEQNDLFQLASKTLLGTRGEVRVSDRTSFGFTLMNLNQQTLSDKVRLNEEPINNTIYGMDGQTGADLNFLTKAIDALPLISTKANSDFTLRGEAAYMSPDPNTKKSTIDIDNGKGIAYIDDFEGAKRTIPLGLSYGIWHDMSVPERNAGPDSIEWAAKSDSARMFSKAKTYWYTVPNDVSVADIWPNKSVARGQENVSVLDIDYNPRGRGAYNYSLNLSKNFGENVNADTVRKNWSGMQRLLSSGIVDLVRENINFIEVWVQIRPGSTIDTTKNKIFIDLGAINEDVIPFDDKSKTGRVHTEDREATPNGILNEGEDTGIDGLTDDEERTKYAAFVESNKTDFSEIQADPAGDDYSYTATGDYRFVDGTENNKNSEIGRYPDADDLNRNNVLDKSNSYFEYELNLDTTVANPQRVGGGSKQWYQYRIPLTQYKNKIGSPDFSLIEYARLWFTGFDKETKIRIAEFNLVGNQWEELKKSDSTFTLAVVNVEDNPEYVSPPGVVRERDRTKPDEQVYGNEQALAIKIHSMKSGESRQAIKRFTYRPLDIFSYRELKMFVRGDEKFSSDPLAPSARIFLRMGSDSLNYYEYSAPLMPSENIPRPSAGDAALIWRPGNNIDIKFVDLTAIKQGRDSTNINTLIKVDAKDGPPGSTYGVLGSPTLTRITFISIGIENPAASKKTIDDATIWVNELRLSDVDDSKGWAYSVSTSVKLADLGAMAFSFSEVDPNFHQLEARFGNRSTSRNWTFSTNLAFERFFPVEWTGTTLPFSFSHTEAISKPKYLPNSDIEVTKAAERQREVVIGKTGSVQAGNIEADRILFESQTLSTTDTYALPTFKISIPSENWVMRDFFNKLSYGFSYTKSLVRTPGIEYQKSWSWNGHLGYSYTTSPDNYISPFVGFENVFLFGGLKDLRIYYPLQNISMNLDAARSQTHQRMRGQALESPATRGLSAHRSLSFSWKLTENGYLNLSGDYSVDIASTLVHLETDRFGRQRNFSSILGDLFFNDQLVSFGYDNSYNQNINVNTHPRIPEFLDINKYLTLSARYSVSYRWQNNLQQGDLGKGTSWGNNISLSSDVSLKQFVETWFPAKKADETQAEQAPIQRTGKGRGHEEEENPPQQVPPAPQPAMPQAPSHDSSATRDTTFVRDSTKVLDTATVVVAPPKPKKPTFTKENFIQIARTLIKTPFLDYDKVNVNFTQTNSSTNGGVPGRPGFANLFGRVPLAQKAEPRFGATRAYQLGLVSDPTENITSVHAQSAFPFIGFSTDQGLRAANALINDSYSQANKITLRTSRDLWSGVRIDLNWNVGWNYTRNQSLHTDSLGRPQIVSIAAGGSVDRSFFTLPPTFVFSMFKSGIAEVGKKYKSLKDNTADTRTDEAKLSDAFETGFESLPIFRKLFGQYLPRVNYSLHWDGLEQLSMFKNFATRVGLDHAYSSSYRRSFKGNLSGGEITESQSISYGFSPLIGLSMTFKELFKGNVNASIRYGTSTAYDLSPSSRNISENSTKELTVSGSFGRAGFEIPFFGLSLSNDIDISFSYSYSKNSRQTFSTTEEITATGIPGEGSSRSVMEPRIRYVLSARVTASLFYRYTTVTPDAGGSRIPGSSTNEGGLDVHIAIQ